MKHLILFLLLALSFNASAENPPPASAFKGELYGYEVAIYVNPIFGSQHGLRASYKANGDWIYLAEPDFYESDIDTKAKADAFFINAISIINTAAYEKLNPITLEPDNGLDRLQWLLENKLTIVDNEIIVN